MDNVTQAGNENRPTSGKRSIVLYQGATFNRSEVSHNYLHNINYMKDINYI